MNCPHCGGSLGIIKGDGPSRQPISPPKEPGSATEALALIAAIEARLVPVPELAEKLDDKQAAFWYDIRDRADKWGASLKVSGKQVNFLKVIADKVGVGENGITDDDIPF